MPQASHRFSVLPIRRVRPGVLLLGLLLAAFAAAPAPASADWRSEADSWIEAHRRVDLAVAVVDADGRPVPDAAVELVFRRHAIPFGMVVTAAYLGITEEGFDALPPEARAHRIWEDIGSWENVLRYRELIGRHYTEVVFENAMKKEPWLTIGGRTSGETDAAFRGEWNVAALRWCRERGIAVRGHVGTWGWAKGARFSDFSEEAGTDWPRHFELWREHLAGQNAFYGHAIAEWDVLNHPVTYPATSLSTKLGGLAFYRDQLFLSRETAPHAERYVNEHLVLAGGHELERYERLVAGLIAADAPLDGIGFQAHFNWTNGDLRKRPTMDVVHDRLERFAAFGKKLKLTELDVTPLEPDRAAREREQAEYLRDLVRVAYAHSAVAGIVQWGFWEPRHGKAALLNRDFSQRPAFGALQDLQNGWRGVSGEGLTTGRTDAGGVFERRLFEGVYDLTATAGDGSEARKSVVRGLALDGERQRLEVRLGIDG